MPFAFLISGLVLVAAGVRGTSDKLLKLLTDDLWGTNNFAYWVISILIIGSLGYIDQVRPFSRALLALVLIVLILSNSKDGGGGGLFVEFQTAIKQITGG